MICSSSKPAPLAASPDVSFLIHTFAASFCSGPKVAAEAAGRGGRGAVRSVLLVDKAGGAPRTAQLRRRLLNGGGAEDEFELLVLGRVAPNLYRGAERLNRLGKRLAAAALVVQLALLKESQLHLHQPGGARVAGRDRLLNPCLRLLALGDAEALGRERDLPAQDKDERCVAVMGGLRQEGDVLTSKPLTASSPPRSLLRTAAAKRDDHC